MATAAIDAPLPELDVPKWLEAGINHEFIPHLGGWYPDSLYEENRSTCGISKHALDDPTRGGGIKTLLQALQISKHSAGPLTHPLVSIFGNPGFMLTPEFNIADSDTWTLPSALNGKPSARLAETIAMLTAAQEEDLWNELVPLKEIPINSSEIVHWTYIETKPTLARETTPLGLPTMVEASASSGKAELHRYVLAGQIGIGFWGSPLGTQFFNAILWAIAQGILAAGQFSAAMALAGAEQQYLKVVYNTEGYTKETIDAFYNRRKICFARLQRPNINTLQMLKIEAENIIKNKHGTAGRYAMVITPETATALTKCHDGAITYHIAGASGQGKLTETIMTKMEIDNIPVYVIPAFRMPNDYAVQAFSHPAENGEMILAFDETPYNQPYDPRSRDRKVYTQDRKYVEVTFEDMLNNLACFDEETGELVRPLKPMDAIVQGQTKVPKYWHPGSLNEFAYFPYANKDDTGPRTLSSVPGWDKIKTHVAKSFFNPINGLQESEWNSTPTDAERGIIRSKLEIAIKEADPSKEIMAGATLPNIRDTFSDALGSLPFNKKTLLALHQAGARVPINIIMGQLHQRCMVHDSAWMLIGGVAARMRKTGNAVIADEIEHHLHQISAEARACSAVPFPRNIAVMPSTLVKQVGIGFGVAPIRPGQEYRPRNYRLNGDMVYIAVPPTFKRNNVPINLNMLGVITDELAKMYASEIDPFHNAYPGYAYYTALFDWRGPGCKLGQPNMRDWSDGYRTVDDPVNFVCCEAAYLMYDTDTHEYTKFRSGNGYWGAEGTYEEANSHRQAGVFSRSPNRGLVKMV